MISRERRPSAQVSRQHWKLFACCSPKRSVVRQNRCASSASAYVLPTRYQRTHRWICCSTARMAVLQQIHLCVLWYRVGKTYADADEAHRFCRTTDRKRVVEG